MSLGIIAKEFIIMLSPSTVIQLPSPGGRWILFLVADAEADEWFAVWADEPDPKPFAGYETWHEHDGLMLEIYTDGATNDSAPGGWNEHRGWDIWATFPIRDVGVYECTASFSSYFIYAYRMIALHIGDLLGDNYLVHDAGPKGPESRGFEPTSFGSQPGDLAIDGRDATVKSSHRLKKCGCIWCGDRCGFLHLLVA